MYNQKEAINVQVLYDLVVLRKNVMADVLYEVSWKIYVESKITDLNNIKVIYSTDFKSSEYCNYSELPEGIKQMTALTVCLIGRWFNDLHKGRDTIMERFKLTVKPTDFWHQVDIFKNDEIKCNNMEEIIQKVVNSK